jgi:hypothetical protein
MKAVRVLRADGGDHRPGEDVEGLVFERTGDGVHAKARTSTGTSARVRHRAAAHWTDSGVSLRTHSVSAWTQLRLPSARAIAPPIAMRRPPLVTSTTSVMTAPGSLRGPSLLTGVWPRSMNASPATGTPAPSRTLRPQGFGPGPARSDHLRRPARRRPARRQGPHHRPGRGRRRHGLCLNYGPKHGPRGQLRLGGTRDASLGTAGTSSAPCGGAAAAIGPSFWLLRALSAVVGVHGSSGGTTRSL